MSSSHSYEWDDWDPYEVVEEADDKLVDRLTGLTYRAVVTFAIGCAEWAVWRFQNIVNDSAPYQYLEVCWAYLLTDRYEAPPELEDEDWKGPVRGAINLALMTVLNSIYGVEDGTPEPESAFSDAVALHILGKHRPYINWRDKVLIRLEKFYKRDESDPNGPYIPREVLNVTQEFYIHDTDVLIKRFLSTLSIEDNPFLTLLNNANDPT